MKRVMISWMTGTVPGLMPLNVYTCQAGGFLSLYNNILVIFSNEGESVASVTTGASQQAKCTMFVLVYFKVYLCMCVCVCVCM